MVACVALCCSARALGAGWQPPGLHPSSATLADVLAASTKAQGVPQAEFAQRREHWTYANGARTLPVDVAVKNDDLRATIAVGTALYDAGRLRGARWRGDANGIVHGLFADQQGDALDRLPQSLFASDPKRWELVGETARPQPAWVLVDRPTGEPATWFFVSEASGLIEREMVREGKRVFTTTFDRFEPVAGIRRPRHWHIADGNAANELDVTVDAIVPGVVPDAAVAVPTQERVFAPPDGSPGVVTLPARFHRGGMVTVNVSLDGQTEAFVLDSGTASITVDARVAKRFSPVLEHATVPRMFVGAVGLSDVSVLTIPIFGGSLAGILGYDFFFGHVVRVDYLHSKVEVLSHEAAATVFADPATVVVPANVDHGLPLVQVRVGPLASNSFAVDTGSESLYALGAFAQRNAAEISAHWLHTGVPHIAEYLEGAVEISPRQVSLFSWGPFNFKDTPIGVQIPSNAPDELTIPFEGIIGTDVLTNFDIYFDYDNNRIGLRR
jgi:hypothetical protein